VYDGNAILTNIEGLIILVTEWGRRGGWGRLKGTEVHVEAGTSIVGRHVTLDSFAPALPPMTPTYSGPNTANPI
jgi:hypothetical protein